ncbi:winged helix-turn-helix transcriptional regulator, partial [Bacillus sp. BNPI-92]
ITRCVYPVVPPKVEYELSEIGHQLENVVTAICDWGDDFSDFVEKDSDELS